MTDPRITNYAVCRGCIHQSEGVCAIGSEPCNHTDFTGKQTGDRMTAWEKKRAQLNGGRNV